MIHFTSRGTLAAKFVISTLLCLGAINIGAIPKQTECIVVNNKVKDIVVRVCNCASDIISFTAALPHDCSGIDTGGGPVDWSVSGPGGWQLNYTYFADATSYAVFTTTQAEVQEGTLTVQAIPPAFVVTAKVKVVVDPDRCDTCLTGDCSGKPSGSPPPPPMPPPMKDATFVTGSSFPASPVTSPQPLQGAALSGQVKASAYGVSLDVPLGRTVGGGTAGNLCLRAATPGSGICSPNCLNYDSDTNNDCQIIYNGLTYIKQAKMPEGLVQVTTNGPYKYTLSFYAATNVGTFTNGVYSLTGSPFSAITIENPDTTGATSNRLCVVDGQNRMFNYEYGANGWTLSTSNNLAKVVRNIVWDTTNLLQQIVTERRDAANNLLYCKSEKFMTNSWGRFLTESVAGVGTDRVTNSIYYGFTTNGHWSISLKAEGAWTWTEFDSRGLATNVYKAFGNQGPTNVESLCGRTIYDRSTNAVSGSGDLGTLSATAPRLVVEKVLGQEVSRSYYVYLDGQVREIRAANPGAAWNDTSNLVTVTKYLSPTNDQFAYRPSSILRPDGTLTLFSYSSDTNGYITNVVCTGQPGVGGTNIIKGTKRTTVYGPFAQAVSDVSVDIISGIILESTIYSDFDNQLRPRKVSYLDGTFTWTDYGCCGPILVTNRDGTVTTRLRDEAGRETAVVEKSITRTNRLGGDGLPRVLQRIGTDGSVTTLEKRTYDSSGRLTSVTNALGLVTSFSETTTNSQRVLASTNPDGSTKMEKYYRDGRLERSVGTAVHGVRYEYGVEMESGVQRKYSKTILLDQSGNDTSEWTKSYQDLLGRDYKTFYSDGSSTLRSFNLLGQLARSVDQDGVTSLFQYDGEGRLEFSVIDANGNGAIDFGGTDRISRVENVVANSHGFDVVQTKQYRWATNNSSISNLVSITEETTDGRRNWSTQFGLTGTRVTGAPVGGTWTETTTAPDQSYKVSLYQSGRLASVTSYDSNNVQVARTSYAYDTHGRQNQTTDGRNGTTTSVFDLMDRVTSVITPAPGTGDGPQTTSSEFDAMGRVFKVSYPDGTSLTNEFFASGELKKTYGSRAYPVEYTYDYAGRMKTMKTWADFSGNAGSAVTTWNYDAYRGFLTNKVYADGKGPNYTYTLGGKLRTRWWARGITTTYGTNTLGDLISISYSDSTPSVTYTLDRIGRRTSISQGANTSDLLLSEAGIVLSEKGSAGTLSGMCVTNILDTFQRSSSTKAVLISPATTYTAASFEYDAAGRLSGVTNGNYSVRFAYLPNSALANQLAFNDGVSQRMLGSKTFDFLNRLVGVSYTAGASTVFAQDLRYNSANQRTRIDQADGSYWIYEYDKLGQVVSGKHYWSDGTPVAGQQYEYAFDDIGNRKQTKVGGDASGQNLRSATYAANTLNQYTSRTIPAQVGVLGVAHPSANVTVNGQATSRKGEYFWAEVAANNGSAPAFLSITNQALYSTTNITNGNLFVPQTPELFSYDADGNLTNDGRWVYTWDAENRLTQQESQMSAPSASKRKLQYQYDHQGRMIRRIALKDSSGSYVTNVDTKFLYDGWRCLAEVYATNSGLVRAYTWGTDLSGSAEGAGGIGGLLMFTDATSSTTNFVSFDANGNVRALAKGTDGSKVAEYEYGPFGEILRSSGILSKANPIRFSTKYQDDETDLLYYGYRFYSASSGRWVSRDAIEEAGGMNHYGFLNNQPLTEVDVLGNSCLTCSASSTTAPANPPPPGNTKSACRGSLNFQYGTPVRMTSMAEIKKTCKGGAPACAKTSPGVWSSSCKSCNHGCDWKIVLDISTTCTIYYTDPKVIKVQYIPSILAMFKHEKCHCEDVRALLQSIVDQTGKANYDSEESCEKARQSLDLAKAVADGHPGNHDDPKYKKNGDCFAIYRW